MIDFLRWFGYGILVYFVVMEAYLLWLAVRSSSALGRDGFETGHGRLYDMLGSDTTPPVSIVVPAYNEAMGICESVRSMAMLKYPRMEILVVNDGSSDDTVERMIDVFAMHPVDVPFRPSIETQPIRRIYRSRLPIPVVLIDKENGGKGDAINAGINVARYPYIVATDADLVFDEECLLRAMRHVVKDRERVVAVSGNVRPLNGGTVEHGRVTWLRLPKSRLERMQIIEYIRSFLAARPAWSSINTLLLVSGALGIFSKKALVEVGGFRTGHLGEDLELTMRLHRHYRRSGKDYRVVHAPDAVAWTEVPSTVEVLRKQRIRWQRGLMQVVWQYKGMMFNPRYGAIGLLAWPLFVMFEFLAALIEFLGWMIVPLALLLGLLNPSLVVPLFAIAVVLGVANSLVALALDERFGYYNNPGSAWGLLVASLTEHFGLRQRLVWWRIRAMAWNPSNVTWGDMERTGVANLSTEG